jgi:RNA polymerase sigma-70 factor (ECF subfamily)
MLRFEDIFEEYQKMVFNLCLQYLQNRYDAEEAMQDIFVKIHKKLKDFESRSSMKTWIYRIAINHCIDVLRNRKVNKSFQIIKNFFQVKNENAIEIPTFDHPGILMENKEELQILYRKIHELPENQKTTIILKYIDDLPQREIATIMNLSEKAVESLLQRAKQNLSNKLKNTEGI